MKRSKSKLEGKQAKRPKQQQESSEDSLSEVEVSFELFNMDIPDFHAVRLLLQQAFVKQRVEVGSVADLICENLSEYIGTCVKQSADDDALGFVTIIPLQLHKQLKVMFEKYANSKCGLLLMERMMNMPSELAKPMYRQLLDDYRQAVEEDEAQFKVKNILIYTPIYWEVESELEKKGNVKTSGPFYYQEEMESLNLTPLADLTIHDADYTADSKRAFSDHGIKQGRRIALITWNQLVNWIESL